MSTAHKITSDNPEIGTIGGDVSILLAFVALYLFEVEIALRDTFSRASAFVPVELLVTVVVSAETS